MAKRYDGTGAYKSKRDRDFRPNRRKRNANLGPERVRSTSQASLAREKSKAFGSFASFMFTIPKYTPPPRPVYPELAEIEGKNVHVSLEHMPGGGTAECTWSSDLDGWYVDASMLIFDMKYRTQNRLWAGRKGYTREQVLDLMRDTGQNALQVLGEAVRKQVATLYMHEIDECLRVGLDVSSTHRVRNPHPQAGAWFPDPEYAHALDDK